MNLITNYRKGINLKRHDRVLVYFVMLEAMIYISFLLLDILSFSYVISSVLKYISICSCFLFVFISFVRTKNKSIALMLTILFFTVIADTFLLFSKRFEIGIASFIIVQILYSFKIKLINCDSCKQYMMEALGVALVWNVIIIFLKSVSLLSPIVVIASFYFTIFSANLLRTWIGVIRSRRRNQYEKDYIQVPENTYEFRTSIANYQKSFAIGLLLFYLCDINVGLNNLSIKEFPLPWFVNLLAVKASLFIWFFYLPSQVILTINGVTARKNES